MNNRLWERKSVKKVNPSPANQMLINANDVELPQIRRKNFASLKKMIELNALFPNFEVLIARILSFI